MNSPAVLCERHIQQIQPFLISLLRVLRHQLPQNNQAELTARLVSAECVQCGIRLAGADLLSVVQAPSPQDPKIQRLRQGYCARRGCDSYYYRLSFLPTDAVDWLTILDAAENASTDQRDSVAATEPVETATEQATNVRPNYRRAMAISIGVFLAVTLWAAREWYLGGTILWLREPENFQVDRDGPEEPAE